MGLLKYFSKRKRKFRGNWILVSPNSFGEVYLTCSLAKAFKKKHGGDLELYLRPEHQVVPKRFYPNRIDVLHPREIDVMRKLCFTERKILRFQRGSPIDLSPITHGDGRLLEFYKLCAMRGGHSGIVGCNAFKYMLHLDWDTPMEKPHFDQALSDHYVATNNLVSKRYVLFLDSNNTNAPAEGNLWKTLAEKYMDLNLNVIVNRKGALLTPETDYNPDVNIQDFEFEEAYYIARNAFAVVGGNNGFMNFLCFSSSSDEDAAHIHCLQTKKTCVNYDLLGIDKEKAFAEQLGKPSFYHNYELISNKEKYTEWSLLSVHSKKQQQELSEDIISLNLESEYINTEPNYSDMQYPDAQDFFN